MKTTTAILLLAFCCVPTTYADTFGSGANTFDIVFVTIGNPGNADDTTGMPNPAGKVDYTYRMGTYEISRAMIIKANAEDLLGITLRDMTSFGGNGADKPATGVTWYEAATFINWLNTSTSNTPAYKFDGNGNFQLWARSDAGYNPNNLYRNSQATYFLPSMDEWYKAAYGNGDTGGYGNYPTTSGYIPKGIQSGTAMHSAVYHQSPSTGPADITLAGGLSHYGTMSQGGNVWEWEETDFDLVNDSSSSARGTRGGSWFSGDGWLSVRSRRSAVPTVESVVTGFRIASKIPEPSTLLLGALASIGLLIGTLSRCTRNFPVGRL